MSRARTLSVASRLLCGATTFFFLAFVFAYFYLRSLNQDHMWRPAHVQPRPGAGRGVHRLRRAERALRDRRRAPDEERDRRLGARPRSAGSRSASLAVAVQCIEYTVAELRAHQRRLRERVLRLERLLPDRRARHDVLARDAGGDRAARAPRTGRQRGRHQGPRPADRPGAGRGGLLLGLPGGRSGV